MKHMYRTNGEGRVGLPMGVGYLPLVLVPSDTSKGSPNGRNYMVFITLIKCHEQFDDVTI